MFYRSFLRQIMVLLMLMAGLMPGELLAQYASLPAGKLLVDEQDRYGHLRYFGFYASAMAHWNFTQELAPFTNLTWIHVGSDMSEAEGIAEILRRLGEADAAGVQAVVSFEPFLFSNHKGDPRPDSEIEDFLVELRAQVEFAGLVDTVAMIYPKDEPFREFVDARNPNFYEQYVSGEVYEDIHRDLAHVNALIKLAFPDTPLGVILSGYEIHHKFFSIPENYDWVGFDCYDNLFRACDDKSFVQTYRYLLDYMQPHQRLMAVPETWATNENLDRFDWPSVLQSRLLHHYEIVLAEPRFVAFIPFIWSFDAGEHETPGLGLNQFGQLYDLGLDDAGSAFVDQVKDIGWQIKSGQPQYPNLSWDETEDSRYRPASRLRGELLSITQGGVVSAWAVDDGLPHKSLRVQVLVRNGDGQIVHKSRKLRANVDDPGLRANGLIGAAFIGLHGFRYQLPRTLVSRSGLDSGSAAGFGGMQLELLVYPDGVDAEAQVLASQPLAAFHRPEFRPMASNVKAKSDVEGNPDLEPNQVSFILGSSAVN